MAGYQISPSGGSALGSLLRKMQEDRLNQPASVPVAAGDSSPIRAQVQGPLQAPESMGSEKVVSIKSALNPGQEAGTTVGPVGTSTAKPGTAMAPSVVAPVEAIPAADPSGLPGISAPPSNFSGAGVQLPGSGNNTPAPQAGGQVQGASTRAATTTTARPGLLPSVTPQPMTSKWGGGTISAPKQSMSTNRASLTTNPIGTTLLPSIMKAASSVGNVLKSAATGASGIGAMLVPKNILNSIKYGLPSIGKQRNA